MILFRYEFLMNQLRVLLGNDKLWKNKKPKDFSVNVSQFDIMKKVTEPDTRMSTSVFSQKLRLRRSCRILESLLH